MLQLITYRLRRAQGMHAAVMEQSASAGGLTVMPHGQLSSKYISCSGLMPPIEVVDSQMPATVDPP